ncbi:MAG: hypothetical protein U5M23_01500 [Marinagarivorans sp.]|nr:hypothetical protein [Marinagarivorans sp.]
MPIPLGPTTFSCPKCGWKKTTHPRGDALMPGEFYKYCPECKGDLEVGKATLLDSLMGVLKG